MLFNRLYYNLKPILPSALRIAARRSLAKRKRLAHAGTWPINPAAGSAPESWPRWPSGKRFALVLTHDVESQEGLNRCRQLMELEMGLGFRSSFNFIPEGDYTTSKELRDLLTTNGFEVGVHDLKHNGKLYASRAEFKANAQRINGYLEDWNAVGFRSGFMHHNLDWLRDLRALYDSSTFDTDPFEPQPDGVNTIFPFWVQGRNGEPGYAELPYTLPQDFTLFVLLREKTIDIWKRKLDWIVEHGGMALLIVHPDYMAFDGASPGADEYPAGLYKEFLDWVKQKYAGQYWHALPKEVAEHVLENKQNCLPPSPKLECKSLPLSGKHAAAVAYSYFPSDPRPRRAAEALVRQGMTVDFICLKQNDKEPQHEIINGVNVFRVPLKRRRGGKFTYAFQYASFILIAFFLLAFRTLKRRYDVVHVHNMPDILVFSALIPKICGAKILLDLHDPMPELMVTIFNLRAESLSVRLLKRLEKWSIRFADMVVTVNLASKKIFSSRSCSPEKICVVMNSPDEQIFGFQPSNSRASNGRDSSRPFVLMYHGSIVERNGLDLAVKALQKVRKSIPSAQLRIYGDGTRFLEEVMGTIQHNGLKDSIHCLGGKNLEEIVKAIDDCDLGLIPNRRSAFAEMNTPTRIFEYLARGKPVIAPRTQGILDYFSSQDLLFFELGNDADLARKIEHVFAHPGEVKEVVRRGQDIYLAHRWNQERFGLLDKISRLLGLQT